MSNCVDCDEAFLRSLYETYHQALIRYVLRLVAGDRRAAEDVAQETLLRAWQHADELRADSAGPWLFTVAHNIAVSTRRRRQRLQETVMDVDAWPALDRDLDAVLDGLVVSAALEALSPPHRAVLVQLYFRGESVEEAAASLGIPEGTVKSRSFYALRSLRDALQEQGVNSQ
jgi:RNA polymerase sigma-70 factor, ECF subfamily